MLIYESNLAASGDSKRFHAYLRQKKVNRSTVGPLLVQGSWYDDNRVMANHLADYFSSVFVKEDLSYPQPHQVSNSQFVFKDLTLSEIVKALLNFKQSPGCGPDELPNILLRKCAVALSYPLYHIFSKSVSCMEVPSVWKRANVMPLFKGGVHSCPSNYRPISMTSVCSKALERLIVSRLYDYLNCNSLLSAFQFGFRAGLSVSDQLLLAYDYVSVHLDGGHDVDVLYFDFRKAFDVVNHKLLLTKLSLIGIGNPLLGWIRDFLTGREMNVVVHGSSSYTVPVTSGVPQGSVIGPVLFLIFINNIATDLTSKFALFADDLKLYIAHPVNDSDHIESSLALQCDVSLLHRRSLSWGLSFSVNKCARIHFSRHNFIPSTDLFIGTLPIPNKTSFRDLGILVDDSLKFHLHVKEVFRKASGVANTILRGTLCRSPAFMLQIFIAHIRPIIDFASVLWNTGYIGDLHLLETVQRHWTKQIDGFADLPYAERLERLNLYSIKGRLLRADLIMVWKVLNGLCPHLSCLFVRSDVDRTRGHSKKLFLPHYSTDVRARFFSIRVISLWNSLPEEAVSAGSVHSFKHHIGVFLGPRLFDFY